MKTIINDRHMMFNVDPIQTERWDGTLAYSIGYPHDYEMKDYERTRALLIEAMILVRFDLGEVCLSYFYGLAVAL